MKFFLNQLQIKLVSLTIVIALITFIACKRTTDVQNTNDNFAVKEAKDWYYGYFKKSIYFKNLNTNSPFVSNFEQNVASKSNNIANGNLKKSPKWSLAQSVTINGVQIVEVPILYDVTTVMLPGTQNKTQSIKKQMANASLSKILFIKQANGSVAIRLVTIVPTVAYATSKNFDISTNSCDNLDNNFSGYVMVKKWDETPVTTTKILNGTAYQKVTMVKRTNNISGKINNSNNLREESQTQEAPCDPWIWVPKVYKTCAIAYQGDEPDHECEEWNQIESPTEGTWEYNPACEDTGEFDEEDLCLLFGIGCPDDEDDDPCEMYGIGCSGENVDCEEAEQEYRRKFDNYISMEPESDISVDGPSSTAGSDPITGRIPWTVAESSFSFWRVEAFSDYEYYKTSYMLITPSGALVNQNEYNITKFESFGSHFVGTHSLFESTWTQTGSALTQILNNNSSNARAKSRISGTIRHKSRTALSIATCGIALFLDAESTIPGNELTFNPQ